MSRQKLSNIISVMSFIGCFSYIYSQEELRLKFGSAIRSIDHSDFLIILFFSLVFFSVVFYRFSILSNSNSFNIKTLLNFKIQGRSHFLGSLLPSGIGVDFFRASFLAVETLIPTSQIVRLIVTDRLISLSLLVISALPFVVTYLTREFGVLIIFFGVACFAFCWLLFRKILINCWLALGLPSLNREVLAWYLCSNVLLIGMVLTCCFLMADPLEFDVFIALSIIPFILFVSSLPISIGGWGSRELTFYYLLPFSGVSGEESIRISISLGILFIVAPFILSLIGVAFKNDQS